jgi:hypothetical protein
MPAAAHRARSSSLHDAVSAYKQSAPQVSTRCYVPYAHKATFRRDVRLLAPLSVQTGASPAPPGRGLRASLLNHP